MAKGKKRRNYCISGAGDGPRAVFNAGKESVNVLLPDRAQHLEGREMGVGEALEGTQLCGAWRS